MATDQTTTPAEAPIYEFVTSLRHAWKAGDPAGVTESTDVSVCSRCGALVFDQDQHTDFHAPPSTPEEPTPEQLCSCPKGTCRGIGTDPDGCSYCWSKDSDDPCPANPEEPTDD